MYTLNILGSNFRDLYLGITFEVKAFEGYIVLYILFNRLPFDAEKLLKYDTEGIFKMRDEGSDEFVCYVPLEDLDANKPKKIIEQRVFYALYLLGKYLEEHQIQYEWYLRAHEIKELVREINDELEKVS